MLFINGWVLSPGSSKKHAIVDDYLHISTAILSHVRGQHLSELDHFAPEADWKLAIAAACSLLYEVGQHGVFISALSLGT
jgi:hypothetical protein